MEKYLFTLGRKKLLSIAELLSVFPKSALKDFNQNIATLELPESTSGFQTILDRLGGIRKIARYLGEFSPELLIQTIEKLHTNKDKKVIFSTSTENLPPRDEQFIKKTLQKIKKILTRERGFKCRYKEQYLGGEGIDFMIYKVQNSLCCAVTVAIQDIRSYAQRDYEKPFRDPRAGMLPPKLAQIMINLSGVKKGTLYDPFCGSGTVLMEAILMGINIIGSDLDSYAVEGTKKNLAWMGLEHTEIFQEDIKKINPGKCTKKPDVIVSEAYLGPFFGGKPGLEQIKIIQEQLEILYKEAFIKLRTFNTPVVLALPCHKFEGQYKFLPHIPAFIKESGFEIPKILPSEIVDTFKDPTIFGFARNRKTFLYDRPDQNVAREIFVLEAS